LRRNQFGAIVDEWRGTKVPGHSLQSTSFLRELCRYRLTLTENRRSESQLFDWCRSLIPGGSRHNDLPQALEEARATFRPTGELPRYTLCLAHETRRRVNAAANAREAAKHELKTQVYGAEGTFWVYVGQGLQGRLTLEPVKNGCFYTVAALRTDGLDLTARGVVHHVPWLTAQRALRPAHALTLASCQGLTLEGRVCVRDTSSRHFGDDYRKLFVALSRAHFDLVEVLP
jgi:hypothetical protein